VVFAPTGRIPSFERRAPWPCLWLGSWTAKITVTLDTGRRIVQFRLGANSTGVPKRFTIALYSVVLIVSEASSRYCEKYPVVETG
jgi:hypothetical protein